MKKTLGVIIFVLLVLLLIRGFWNTQLMSVSSSKEEKTVVIAKGQSLDEIVKLLKKEGLIKSEWAFKMLVKQKGWSQNLKAGSFKLSPGQSAEEILENLIKPVSDEWVTLIEGWRVEEMAEKLTPEFIKIAKEGYVFPDTYLIPKEYDITQIVRLMRDNFDKKYSSELRSKIKAKGLTEDEGVILASIVEREARSDKVRTEVAGILLKRLKINMGLNVDATIQYALGYQSEEKSWWKRHLTKEDLKVNSPYNTYLHRGLPPTPICNPSLSSLQAVANADPNTPYLYYYHDSKGNSHYAKTLEEHNQNVVNNP